ncbi:MAG: hypothetical protein ACR2HA_10010 [Nocardioides sp.]
MRSRLVLSAVLVVALAVGGVVAWRWTHQQSEFAAAVELAPAGTERVGWTDWADIRGALGLETGAAAGLDLLMDAAYRRDLSSASALGSSAEVLDARFGVSPANLEWEVFAQSADGAALILKVPESVSFTDLGDRLEGLGFLRPNESDGTWAGGSDVVARIGTLTPQLQYWNLIEDDRLVVTSDTKQYAGLARRFGRG